MDIAGIEFGARGVKGVVLGMKKGRVVVARCGAGRGWREVVGDEVVVAAVETGDVLVRVVELAVGKEKEIAAVRDFQVEALLPFPVEEAVLDHLVLEKEKGKSRIAVLSVPKERLGEYLAGLGEVGLEPESVSCVPVALGTLVHYLVPSREMVGVLHVGQESTTCVVVQEGKVVAARAVAYGAQDFEGVSFFDVEPGGKGEKFRGEVARSFVALAKGREVGQVFLSGEFGSCKGLDGYLGQALDVALVRLPQGELAEKVDVERYAVPLGLALGGLLKQKGVEFRQGDFAYPKPWRRVRGKLLAYAGLCAALAVALVAVGMVLLKRQEAAVLALAEGADGAEEVLEMVEERLAVVEAVPETFPLKPDVPSVGELLAWIASHPFMEKLKMEGLRYQMVKRPSMKRPQERYGVQVELEFTAESPTAAREFHDALLAGDRLVDGDVKWSVAGGRYRATFLLKDRTSYVS